MSIKGTSIRQLCQAYLDSNYISEDTILDLLSIKKSIKIVNKMEKIRNAYFDNVVDVAANPYDEDAEDVDTYAKILYEYLIELWEKQCKGL